MGRTLVVLGGAGFVVVMVIGARLVSARRTKSGYLGGVQPGHPIPKVHLATGKTASAMVEWVTGFQSCPRAVAEDHGAERSSFGSLSAEVPGVRAPLPSGGPSGGAGRDRAEKLSVRGRIRCDRSRSMKSPAVNPPQDHVQRRAHAIGFMSTNRRLGARWRRRAARVEQRRSIWRCVARGRGGRQATQDCDGAANLANAGHASARYPGELGQSLRAAGLH